MNTKSVVPKINKEKKPSRSTPTQNEVKNQVSFMNANFQQNLPEQDYSL